MLAKVQQVPAAGQLAGAGGAHLRSGVCSAPFSVDRQGLVSHTMGIFPPSLAFMSASCKMQIEAQPMSSYLRFDAGTDVS